MRVVFTWSVVVAIVLSRSSHVLSGEGALTDERRLALLAPETFPTAVELTAFDLTDLDGDGDLDVVACATDGRIHHAFGSAEGFTTAEPVPGPTSTVDELLFADVDGLHGADLITLRTSRQLGVHLRTASGEFSNPYLYLGGNAPTDLETGDLNRDGLEDVVVSSRNPDQLNVRLATGVAEDPLSPLRSYSVGERPERLAIADIDGDGDFDVVCSNLDGRSLSILRGRGDGTLEAAESRPLTAAPADLAAADLDGDGRIDIAVVHGPERGGVSFLFGEPDGSLGPARWADLVPGASEIRAGDLDDDGVAEWIVFNPLDHHVRILRVDDEARPVELASAFVPSGASPRPSDLDGDGEVDAVVLAGAGDEEILVVSIHFEGPRIVDCDGNGEEDGEQVRANPKLDLDADGAIDACVVTSSVPDCDGDGVDDAMEIVLGALDCNLNGVPDDCESSALRSTVGDFKTVRTDWDESVFALGDFDGDGSIDAAVATGEESGLAVFLNNRFGALSGVRVAALDGRTISGVFADDLNADGRSDLIALDRDLPGVLTLLSTGSGPLEFEPARFTVTLARAIRPADLDGDGVLDLLSADDVNGLRVFPGLAEGGFGSPFDPVLGDPVQRLVTEIHSGDLDGDGILDVLVQTSGNDTLVYLGEGGGRLQKARRHVVGRGGLVLADFDDDGVLDLLSRSFRGSRVLFGEGDGTFVLGPEVVGLSAQQAVDLNGDGRLDLTGSSRGLLAIAYGLGNGRFSPIRQSALPGSRHGWVDLDGDGDLDWVGSSKDLYTAGNEQGRFLTAQAVSTEARRLEHLALEDLDADGRSDLVYAEGVRIHTRLARPDGSFAPASTQTLTSLSFLAAARIDADEHIDLVVGLESNVHYLIRGRELGELGPLEAIGPSEGTSLLRVEDLNDDGAADILRARESGRFEIHFGDGAGGFSPRVEIEVPSSPQGFAVADLDENGSSDLIVRHDRGRRYSVLLADGHGGYERTALELPSRDVEDGCFVGDFDGDGHVDFLSVGTDGFARTFFGDGTGALEEALPIDLGREVGTATLGHFDGDRNLDLVYSGGGSVDSIDRMQLSIVYGPLNPGSRRAPPLAIAGPAHRILAHDVDATGRQSIAVMAFLGLEIALLVVPPWRYIEEEDCDATGFADSCETASGVSSDCDGNGRPDDCDLAAGRHEDCDGDGVPDSCELLAGTLQDCDENGIPDSCDDTTADCDDDGVPDSCEIASGVDLDSDLDGIPDSCQDNRRVPGDCNNDARLDLSDGICVLMYLYVEPRALPCSRTPLPSEASVKLLDWNDSNRIDVSDAVRVFLFLFRDGPPHPLWLGAGTCVPIDGCEMETVCP